MFAVIKSGGKQYKVAASDLVKVERVDGAAGDTIAFTDVLLVGDEAGQTVGSPLVAGASVSGEIVDQVRDGKILVFKKRRRQNSQPQPRPSPASNAGPDHRDPDRRQGSGEEGRRRSREAADSRMTPPPKRPATPRNKE